MAPGIEIPPWFNHQRDEASIKIPLPPNIQNDSQWIGLACCCIFVSSTNNNHDACKQEDMWIQANISGNNSQQVDLNGFDFGGGKLPLFTNDHLWLHYWSRDKLYPFTLEKICGETKNLSSMKLEDRECDKIFESKIYCMGSLKVKKCGVRIVYEKDLWNK